MFERAAINATIAELNLINQSIRISPTILEMLQHKPDEPVPGYSSEMVNLVFWISDAIKKLYREKPNGKTLQRMKEIEQNINSLDEKLKKAKKDFAIIFDYRHMLDQFRGHPQLRSVIRTSHIDSLLQPFIENVTKQLFIKTAMAHDKILKEMAIQIKKASSVVPFWASETKKRERLERDNLLARVVSVSLLIRDTIDDIRNSSVVIEAVIKNYQTAFAKLFGQIAEPTTQENIRLHNKIVALYYEIEDKFVTNRAVRNLVCHCRDQLSVPADDSIRLATDDEFNDLYEKIKTEISQLPTESLIKKVSICVEESSMPKIAKSMKP